MELRDIKLTNEMINIALRDIKPSANIAYHSEPLPFKKVIITKHASERFNKRFNSVFKNIDIAKKIASNLRNGYQTYTYKDTPSFALEVKFGEVSTVVHMVKAWNQFNPSEEIYLVKTFYLNMDEAFLNKLNELNDKEIEDKIFKKMMKDQFFKGKTEEEIFAKIDRPDERIVKRIRKAINDSYKMVDPIKQLANKVDKLAEVREHNDNHKFGDGSKPKPKLVDDTKYINHSNDDFLDDLLDETLFDLDDSPSQFKFGEDGKEELPKRRDDQEVGLDLDPSDFPW